MITGCSSVQISKESLQSINTINIDTHVTIPDEPFVQGNIDPISGVLFGPIGAGVSHAMSSNSTSKQFQKIIVGRSRSLHRKVVLHYTQSDS